MGNFNFAAIPSDKDGCLVVLPKLNFLLAKCHLMDSPWYEWVSPAIDYSYEVWQAFKFHPDKLVDNRYINKSFPGLFGVLTRDAVSIVTKGIVSVLGATCKTHKLPGEVTLRPLHKSVGNPLNPAMRLLRYFFRLYLADVQHIVKNSLSLKKKLEHIRVLINDLLVKVDVRDFFLSGRASALPAIYAQSLFPLSSETNANNFFCFFLNISTSLILRAASFVVSFAVQAWDYVFRERSRISSSSASLRLISCIRTVKSLYRTTDSRMTCSQFFVGIVPHACSGFMNSRFRVVMCSS